MLEQCLLHSYGAKHRSSNRTIDFIWSKIIIVWLNDGASGKPVYTSKLSVTQNIKYISFRYLEQIVYAFFFTHYFRYELSFADRNPISAHPRYKRLNQCFLLHWIRTLTKSEFELKICRYIYYLESMNLVRRMDQ